MLDNRQNSTYNRIFGYSSMIHQLPYVWQTQDRLVTFLLIILGIGCYDSLNGVEMWATIPFCLKKVFQFFLKTWLSRVDCGSLGLTFIYFFASN